MSITPTTPWEVYWMLSKNLWQAESQDQPEQEMAKRGVQIDAEVAELQKKIAEMEVRASLAEAHARVLEATRRQLEAQKAIKALRAEEEQK
jgi:hypothetical protein